MNALAGKLQFTWTEKWATIVQNESGRLNGRTHGIQEASDGTIVVFCQAEPSVLIFDDQGRLRNSWGNYSGAHGLTLVHEEEVDYLWLTDQYSGEVLKTTLDGTVVLSLPRPSHPVYANGDVYAPTWVAVNERRHGGNGDIWVADGYGSNLVSRFGESGQYIQSIDGSDGAGAFSCPHGIYFDNRSGEPTLLVADRANHRIQAFNEVGKFLASFGEDTLSAPDCFSTYQDLLLVPELLGRVAVLDRNFDLIGYLGRNDQANEMPGWPDLSPEQLQAGKFSSPHGGTFDRHGNIYVVEWIVGGRIIKLVAN